METKNFQVKEASVIEFFEKYGAADRNGRRDIRDNANPYNFFKDEIFLKKSVMDVIDKDPIIEFTLSDYASGSNKPIVNTYLYSIEQYDDVCLKLELIDFAVSFKA